jgi:hypothetical protein
MATALMCVGLSHTVDVAASGLAISNSFQMCVGLERLTLDSVPHTKTAL